MDPKVPFLQRLRAAASNMGTLRRAGLLAAWRPDKYVRMAAVIARQGATNTVGISMSARRCGDRTAIIDEFGALTFRQLDDRAELQALGVALAR